MSEIRVTGETRYYEDREVWDCSAYGGGTATNPGSSVEVRVEGSTEDEVKAAFIDAWNTQVGTTWTAEEFEFTHNEGRRES